MRKRRNAPSVCLLLIITMMMASCSSTKASGKNNKTTGTNDSSNGNPSELNPSASPFSKEFSAVKLPAPALATRKEKCLIQFAKASDSGQSGSSDSSSVTAYINPNREMGEKCKTLGPGSECWIPFIGGWKLVGSPSGSMVFQVFENDSAKPIRSPEVGPIPSGGKFSDSTRLFYRVSPDATKATFRVVLKDATGKVVSQSAPQTISLPACFGDPEQEQPAN